MVLTMTLAYRQTNPECVLYIFMYDIQHLKLSLIKMELNFLP